LQNGTPCELPESHGAPPRCRLSSVAKLNRPSLAQSGGHQGGGLRRCVIIERSDSMTHFLVRLSNASSNRSSSAGCHDLKSKPDLKNCYRRRPNGYARLFVEPGHSPSHQVLAALAQRVPLYPSRVRFHK